MLNIDMCSQKLYITNAVQVMGLVVNGQQLTSGPQNWQAY